MIVLVQLQMIWSSDYTFLQTSRETIRDLVVPMDNPITLRLYHSLPVSYERQEHHRTPVSRFHQPISAILDTVFLKKEWHTTFIQPKNPKTMECAMRLGSQPLRLSNPNIRGRSVARTHVSSPARLGVGVIGTRVVTTDHELISLAASVRHRSW